MSTTDMVVVDPAVDGTMASEFEVVSTADIVVDVSETVDGTVTSELMILSTTGAVVVN